MDILSLGTGSNNPATHFDFCLVSPLPGLSSSGAIGERPAIFTHIPRTGGVTIDAIFLGVAAVLNRPWIRLAGDSYDQYWGEKKADVAESIQTNSVALSKAYYVSGHVPYGLQAPLRGPPVYITLLRDPHARIWSQLRRIARSAGPIDDSHAVKILKTGQVMDNCQVRMVAGCWDTEEKCDDAMYSRAVDNLTSRYTLFGLTELLPRFLSVLATGLGWPSVLFRQRNQSLHLADRPPDAVSDVIDETNEYDTKLLEIARSLISDKESEYLSMFSQSGLSNSAKNVLFSIDPVTISGQSMGLLQEDKFSSLKSELDWYDAQVKEYPGTTEERSNV